MSHISYAFNHSDIEATAYALTVLPRLGLAESEAQAEINYQLCCSAAKKLINHATDITPDEFRTIIAALQAAKLIILGDIEVDAKTCSECKSYFFTINKLLSTFEKPVSYTHLVPTSAIFCPRSILKFNGFDNGSSYPVTRSCVSNNIFPGVRP